MNKNLEGGNKMKRILLFMLVPLVLVACGNNEEAEEESAQEPNDTADEQNEQAEESQPANSEPSELLIELNDGQGELMATATLSENDESVNVELDGANLPAGTHGFHIHENGECEGPDFESAGGHFNPTDANHGFDDPDGPHAGDLENIEVADDGTVHTEVTADMVTMETGQENSLFKEGNTALVIHSDADDYSSQPSGDAGDRIACGVIEE